jgi:hypothetical protein
MCEHLTYKSKVNTSNTKKPLNLQGLQYKGNFGQGLLLRKPLPFQYKGLKILSKTKKIITMDGKLLINDKEYILTKHALKRMNSRNVTIEDLIDALSSPKQIRRQVKEGYNDAYSVLGRNRVVVILNLEMNVIVTVHRINSKYAGAKGKHGKNKKRRDLIKIFGNRVKR